MKWLKISLFGLIVLLPALVFAQQQPLTATQKTAQYFASIQNDPNQLLVFLSAMPKGAQLHYHFSGATYAENLLDYAKNDKSCLDQTTFTIQNTPNCHGVNLGDIAQQSDLYQKTIDAWSMRDFISSQNQSADDHFFATFIKFSPLVSTHASDVLNEIKKRAYNQHVDYLETLISSYDINMPMGPDGDPSTTLATKLSSSWDNTNWSKDRAALLNNGLPQIITETKQHITAIENQSNQQLHCGTSTADPACQIQVRFQYYALRHLPPPEFFAQLLTGFEVANSDPDVVGINIVGPEDNYVSTHNYTMEMHMINYLHSVYPKVNIDLHAGELNPTQVTPEELRYHVRQAVEIADAQRIGHGTDIAYENNANQLMDEMATKKIADEINLTSNAELLNITGNQEPVLLYLSHHVPIVLSTDDEGVLRTNINHEYQTAILNYHLSYLAIKNIARNGITYSFLPGTSLWQNPENATPVAVCSKDILGSKNPSANCQTFLKNNQKAQAQWKLESEFESFERSF